MIVVLHPPPDVTSLGEGGGLDDLGRHPGVRPGGRHPRRVVGLPRQTEVRYLERLEEEVVALPLDVLEDQGWKKGEQDEEHKLSIDIEVTCI